MTVLFDFDVMRPTVLGRVAETRRQTNAGISGPRKDHLACATCPDHLVIDEIRCEPDQCQIATTLSNNLVSGSEGNKMAEAFGSHRITIVYERADGLFEAANSRHTREAEQTHFHSAETKRTPDSCYSKCSTFHLLGFIFIRSARRQS